MKRHPMRRHLMALALPAVLFFGVTAEASWIFRPSSYTHDPRTYERTAQFAPKQTAYVPSDPTYQRSAYRHHRSNLRVGGSADRLHLVETWGAGDRIRPYGEWQQPFRAGATPYGPWGNPDGRWTSPYGPWGSHYGLGDPNHLGYPGYPGYSSYPHDLPPGQGYGPPYGGASSPFSADPFAAFD